MTVGAKDLAVAGADLDPEEEIPEEVASAAEKALGTEAAREKALK